MMKPVVRLRPITEADLPDRVRWFNDPEVTKWLVHEGERTLGQEREWFATLSSRELPEVLAIEVDGRHIGDAALRNLGNGVTADFGILIGEKSCWGQGYGAAATCEMLRIGFSERGLHRVQLDALATNARAIRCYEKCGFRREGVQRQTVLKRGVLADLVIMGLLREEWEARRRGLAPDQVFARGERAEEWRRCMDALAPQPGERIVDAGCGDGRRMLLIATLVGNGGRVIGIEKSQANVETAIRRIQDAEMQDVAFAGCADIRSLPLPDGSVDAWFCRETLEYLDDPHTALLEAMRVVRPGGRVVAVEADWDTLAYNAIDKAAERRFVAVHTDCGGGPSINGRTGRKLLSLFREAGLADCRLNVHTVWSDQYAPQDEYVCKPLGDGAVRRGRIGRQDLDAWYADLSAQAQRGRYFHCFSYFICRGHVATDVQRIADCKGGTQRGEGT